MKQAGRKILIFSQVFVVITFFTGMMMNYFVFYPVFHEGETFRIMKEIDNYRLKFYAENGCNPHDEAQRDSVLTLNVGPYYGDMMMADSNGDIFYAKNGENGNILDVLEEKYGEMARAAVLKEYANPTPPTSNSRMKYERSTRISYYANFNPEEDMMFFYASDYGISGRFLYRKLIHLTIFMLVVGLLLIIICLIIIERIKQQSHRDIVTQKELDTASKLQKSMLPRGERHLMQIDVNARLIPAKKVGGDFYYYLLRKGKLYFCIGDVSGKGIPAAIFMSKAVTLFRTHANSLKTPLDIARCMNEELCINNDSNMFLTAIVGVVNVYDGKIDYVNAGHEYPIIWNGIESSPLEYLKTVGNVPLGLMSDAEYVDETYEIEKDGLFLLYTDGVSEARAQSGEFLGREKLLERMEPLKLSSAKEINDALVGLVSEYEHGAPQSDDITLLTFRNISKSIDMTIRSEVPELKKIVPFLDEIFRECPLDAKECTLVRSGLDEALTNCVFYAYDAPGGEIKVTARILDKSLVFTIEDSGKPFNPLEYESESADENRVGGLGIYMMRSIFDGLRYRREDGTNILELIKKL